MKAQIMTPYIGTGIVGEDEFRPQIIRDYPLLCADVTGLSVEQIIPGPNLLVVDIDCSLEIMNAIENDNNCLVIWSE